jgi:hypothetical protein
VRTADQAPPVYTPAPIGPGAPIAAWPAIPRIVIERLPTYAYTWDDEDVNVVWDAAGDVYVWDDPATGAGFTDAVCDFVAVELEAGNPDELGLFASARAVVTLDNRSGEWSIYDESGRLVYFAPGRRLQVGADIAGVWWWLFAGVIDRWDVNADDTVTVEAHDRFGLLAQGIGTFTPGVAGQRPRERIGAIRAAAGDTGPYRADPGDVTLTVQATERAPLEEAQTVALSDGGALYVDADGALEYRDRLWPRGRADQTVVPLFSDNVCDAGAVVVANCELSTSDDHLATSVHLVNVAGTVADAATTDPLWADRPYPLTHPEPDQWTTAGEGQAVANHLINLYGTPAVGIARFELHLTDPRADTWTVGIDRRLGDRVDFMHDFLAAGGGVGTFNVTAIVTTITHQIDPESWVVGIGTGPAIAATPVQRWDRTAWTWDDPLAEWDR